MAMSFSLQALVHLSKLKELDADVQFHIVTDTQERFQSLYLSHTFVSLSLRLTADSNGYMHSDDTFNLANQVEVNQFEIVNIQFFLSNLTRS